MTSRHPFRPANRPFHPRIRNADYLARVLSIQSAYIKQALTLEDASGTVAVDRSTAGNNGKYFNTGAGAITYREPGPTAGLYSIKLPGDNTGIDMVDQDGNTLAGAWNGDLCSAISWGRVDTLTRWTDAASYRYLWHVRDAADSTYYYVMGKTQTENQFMFRRRAGGPNCEIDYTFASPPTDFFCTGLTFNLTGNGGGPILNAYVWTSALGFLKLTPNTSASLTTFGTHKPTGGTSVLGAGSLTLQEWFGWLGLTVTWCGVALSDAEMQQAMVP
jgi:hypothetical protein